MKGFKLDNQWLTRFRLDITSSSNRLYANGRQQVEVTVTLEPRKGETLSEESLNSLSLVLIDEDGEPRLLDHPDLFASKRAINGLFIMPPTEAPPARSPKKPQTAFAASSTSRPNALAARSPRSTH